jgi:hypothetical protein
MTSSRSVVLVAPVRTAIGTFGGSLKEVSASDLGPSPSVPPLSAPVSSLTKSALSSWGT